MNSNRLDNQTHVLLETDHKNGAWISIKKQLTSHNGNSIRGLTLSENAVFFDKKNQCDK